MLYTHGRDLDQDMEERAYQFLRNTLIFIAHFLDTGVDELAMILEHVFDQRTQPFYANRSVASRRIASVDLHVSTKFESLAACWLCLRKGHL